VATGWIKGPSAVGSLGCFGARVLTINRRIRTETPTLTAEFLDFSLNPDL